MTEQQIKDMMRVASANGDILHYQRLRERLIKLTGKDHFDD